MDKTSNHFAIFLWRVCAMQIITYSIIGWIALAVLDYREFFSSEHLSLFMKSMDSPWITAGPGLQIIRGVIFAVVLWPFHYVFLNGKFGWLKLWALFLGLAILSTTGPSPGSIEGLIYSKIPVKIQLLFLPELIIQTLLFSVLLVCWFKKPLKLHNIIAIIMVVLIVFMSIAGTICMFFQNWN